MLSNILFFVLAGLIVAFALGVILHRNPIGSALSLVMTMVFLAALFFKLGAYFIAGVQLIVYAGAVMVLFVMVLMLFDLSHEGRAFTRGIRSSALKIFSVGLIPGIVAMAAWRTVEGPPKTVLSFSPDEQVMRAKELGVLVLTDYLIVFEVLGVLLLVIAIGVVALARSRGGSHAKP